MGNLNETHWNITYPKFENTDEQNSKGSRTKDPVIMLFGWMGANDRYLKVYSQLYEEKGFPTVRMTVSPLIVLFKHYEMNKYSNELIKLLDESHFKDRPLILHIFSNGGCFQYEDFSAALSKNKDKIKQLKGLIIDSGPAPWTIYNSFSVIWMLLGTVVKTRLISYPLTLMAMGIAFTLLGVRKIQKDIFKQNVYFLDPYNNFKNQNNICPQHFIYSKADDLVPYKRLESLIDRRKAIGVDVTTKIYEKTPHVKHYPSDKLGYCKSVFKFVNKVLKK